MKDVTNKVWSEVLNITHSEIVRKTTGNRIGLTSNNIVLQLVWKELYLKVSEVSIALWRSYEGL